MGKKISELEARTALSNNDIFVVVDEPGTGSAETAKVTYTTLRDSIIAEAGFNTVGNDQILDPASAGGNVTINASATVNGDFTVSGNTIIDAGSQIVSDPNNPITINPGGTGDTIIESELITNGPLTANNNLSVNGNFSVTGDVDGIGLLDLDNANTSKIADGTAGFLLQTDGAGNFAFVQGASTKGTFTDGSGVSYDDQQYSIVGITQANPAVITVATGHNLVNGDSITVTGVNGMTEVNDQTYFVSVSGDALTLYSDSGLSTQVNSTGFTAYIDSGNVDSGDGAFVPGTGTSSINDLSDVDTATTAPSSGDALKWNGTSWVPVASAEIDPAMTPTDGQALVWDDQQYEITNATQTNPVQITLPNDHNLKEDDAVTISGVGGMTELNGQTVYLAIDTSTDPDTITLYDTVDLVSTVDGTGYGAYTSGGVANAGSGNWVANVAISSMSSLTDTDVTGLADNHILKYNNANTTWTTTSADDLLLSVPSVPRVTWRGEDITTSSLQNGDFIVWDAQTYNISNIIKGVSTLADIPGHNFSNGDIVTISGVQGMTQINGQSVYVQPMTQNGVGFFTDAEMTTYYNSSSHSNYTAGTGVATGTGTWRIHRGQSMDGSTGVTPDFDALALDVEQLNVFQPGGTKADTADFADEDLLKWDNFEYAIDNVFKNGTGPTSMRFQEPHYMKDGTKITPSNVAGGMGTTINGNNYYVKSINTTAVELYTDEDLTTGLNTQASASYISAENDVISSDEGCWKVDGDLGGINNLTDVSLSNVGAMKPYLKYNVAAGVWENVDGATMNLTPYQYLDLGYTIIDEDTIQEGQTVEWRKHEWDIVNVTESGNQLYIDFGPEAWADDGLGMVAWVVFDMSGAVGATEIGYQAGVWHQIIRQNGDPSISTFYSITAGNIHSTDATTQYLGPNTSAWTSGGKVKMVLMNGANSAGSFVAVDQGGSGSSNTGGVPITSPEGELDAGDVLTWSDGTVGRGQIGGITNTGTQPTYVTSSELGHEVEFSRPGSPVIMPSPDTADYWNPGGTLSEIDAYGYDRVVGRFLDLHDAGGSASALNSVYLELTTASTTVANSNPEGAGKRRYHMIKLNQSTRARLTHANGEYQVYEAPSGSPDINGITAHDADARFERVDPATGLAMGSWVALSSGGSSGAAVLNISDTPPGSPSDGELWWESDTGRLKLYYNDGSSSQWVDAFTTSTAADKNIFNSTTQEKTNVVTNAGSGGKDYDCSSAGIHHLSNIAGDIDANLTNLSLDTGYSTTVTFVLNQSSTPKVIKTLSIGGSSQTINWVGGVVPTGTASGVDAMSFSLIRTGASAYTVLGQLVPFS